MRTTRWPSISTGRIPPLYGTGPSADIIDKIGDRHLEIRVPVPRDTKQRADVSQRVMSLLEEQESLLASIRKIANSNLRMTRERASSRYGFRVERSAIRDRILIPKYYDPELEADLAAAEQADSIPWVS